MLINIAIDGPSAAGKSTIADILAAEMGYIHLDTGAMYRCVALACLKNGIDCKDEDNVRKILPETEISFDPQGNVYLNRENVSKEIRQDAVSLRASDVSTLLSVREDLVSRQKEFARNKGIIMDGRDIGTVVLKDAEVKIFLTASSASRAERRYLQNQQKGIESDFDQLVREIEERDYQDSHREHSPLRQAEDAIRIDSSDMSVQEVAQAVRDIIKGKFPEGVLRND